MGVSMMSALIIQTRGDDVRCEAKLDQGTMQYVGWIMLYRGEHFDHPIIDTGPSFDTAEDALNYCQSLVKQIREMKLDNPLDDLPHGEEIKEVINQARE